MKRASRSRTLGLVLLMALSCVYITMAQQISQTDRGLELSMDLQDMEITKVINGNRYLFDGWNQNANITLLSGEVQVIRNVNIDGYTKQLHYIVYDGFETQTKMILPNNVDYFTINGTKYFIVYFNDDSWIVEEVRDGFYKTFETEIIPASSNPMVNRPNDKFVFKTIYVVREDNIIGFERVSKRKFNKLLNEQK